jgi:hypothetical protein
MLPISLRTVSEAPRPHEEIGWSGAGSWPWWFRYGVMKEAFPGLAPNCYAFCIGDGWCPDLLINRGRGYHNLRYLLLKAKRMAVTNLEFVAVKGIKKAA